MGWPRTAPLPLPPRRVRAARQRATTVVDEVFLEFSRAVEAGDSHVQDRLVDGPVSPIHPKASASSLPPKSRAASTPDPRLGRAARP